MTLSELATNRFAEGYKAAQGLTKAGRFISLMAIIFALPLVISGFAEAGTGKMGFVLFLWSLGGMLGLIGYGLGKAITAKACLLRATIDQAVNTCSLLNEVDRAEVMSLHPVSPWRQLGIDYSARQTQPTSNALSRNDAVHFYSPIATLFESTSATIYSAPLVRSERHLARAGRRRAR